MKKYKCSKCKNEVEVLCDTAKVMCGCGHEMIGQIPNNRAKKIETFK